MKPLAKEFRAAARASLRGYWGIALAVCLVAGILGGASKSVDFSSIFRFVNDRVPGIDQNYIIQGILNSGVIGMASTWGLAVFIVGGAVELGLCVFHTRLSLGHRPSFGDLFERFDVFLKALGLRLFTALFVLLWMLLLIVPGIIAGYRYAMATYLMAEYPQMGIREAVDRSKQLMQGNKGRLFCLHLSFIGWWLLSLLTLGILSLWITPYMQTAQACFYLELTGRQYGVPNANA